MATIYNRYYFLSLLQFCYIKTAVCIEISNNNIIAETYFTHTTIKSDITSQEELDRGLIPIVTEVYLASESENLTLLSQHANSEILITAEMLRNSKEFQNVVLACNSFYPIQWIYQGDGAPMRMYSTEIRTVGDMKNESSYEYYSTLILMPERNNEHLTGTYICKGVNHPKQEAFHHLYFPGSFGFPTIRNRVIRISHNQSEVTIPCSATNPELEMSLHKTYPKEEATSVMYNSAIAYNSKTGYSMDIKKIEDPYGTYYCSVNGQFSFWKIDIVRRKDEDVRVEPNTSIIEQKNFVNQTFRCSSLEKFKFILPNSYKFGIIEYTYNKSADFPYSGIFNMDSNFPINSYFKYIKINCVTERNHRLLHSWELSSIGTEELSIKYDKYSQRILCCSKSGLSPLYEYVKCETKTDCLIKKKCFINGRCEYPFPPNYVDAPIGCTGIEFLEGIPTHVAKCTVGDKSQIVPIMENILKNDILIDENDEMVPETRFILKISAIMNSANLEVKFKCSGSLYYFSSNFVFALEKVDGTMEFVSQESIEMFESHEPILKTNMDSSIRRIICFAPLTLSSEWRNVSMSVLITEPVRSKTTLSTSSSTNPSSRVGSSRRRSRT